MPLSEENEHQGKFGTYIHAECVVCKQKRSTFELEIPLSGLDLPTT